MLSNGLDDCSKCGAKGSAWPDHFCGSCEEAYHREEGERQQAHKRELAVEVARRDAVARAKGHEISGFAVKRDGLGDYYIARCEWG